MSNIFHALLIIMIFGMIFFVAMWWENKILIKQGKEPYDLPETLANIASSVLYKVTDGLFMVLVLGSLAAFVHSHGLQIKIHYNWFTYILLFVLLDLTFYLWHYLTHKVRYAWIAHKIHHSSQYFNFGVALRQSLLFPIYGVGWIVWIPWVFLGFDIQTIAFLYELNLLFQFFIHTQTINRLPNWVEWIFNTPSHHRVHHGCAPAQIDCNFGGTLIIWDRLFGTFVDERQAGTIVYGVKSRPITSNHVLHMIFEEAIDLFKTAYRNKDLRYFWKHPDWVPDEAK